MLGMLFPAAEQLLPVLLDGARVPRSGPPAPLLSSHFLNSSTILRTRKILNILKTSTPDSQAPISCVDFLFILPRMGTLS